MSLYRTIFTIAQMDCPSEEQLIRMKLEPLPQVKQLKFDIASRTLVVTHKGNWQPILTALEKLRLGAVFQTSAAVHLADHHIALPEKETRQRRLLIAALMINFFFFVAESLFGMLSGSMGLLADGLDMLADSLVYGMALFAVGRAALRKKQIARISGYFQLMLAIFGLLGLGTHA